MLPLPDGAAPNVEASRISFSVLFANKPGIARGSPHRAPSSNLVVEATSTDRRAFRVHSIPRQHLPIAGLRQARIPVRTATVRAIPTWPLPLSADVFGLHPHGLV